MSSPGASEQASGGALDVALALADFFARKRKKTKRRTIRSLSIEELQARYDRAVDRAFRAFRRADKLKVALERRLAVPRAVAAQLAGEEGPRKDFCVCGHVDA